MKGLFMTVNVGGMLVLIAGLYSDLDPLCSFIRYWNVNYNSIIFRIIRAIIAWIGMWQVVSSILLFLLGAMVLAVIVDSSLSTVLWKLSQIHVNDFYSNKTSMRLLQVIRNYQAIQIYVNISKPFYRTEAPILLFFGSLLAVLANFVSLKMYHILRFEIYIVAPLISCLVFAMMVTIMPQAGNIFEKCELVLRTTKGKIRSKYAQKILISLKCNGVDANFFVVKSSVRTKTVEMQFYYTVNALISVEV